VEAVGPGAAALPGQPVLVTLIRSCGGCGSCAGGAPAYCETPGATAPATTETGELAARMMACGAFAEAVVVHQSQIVPIPDDMAMDAASLCPAASSPGSAR
jgi:S-(hydroxymethyl)glutathione dehydrogenase / alcohol dehydrogenase